MMDRIFSFFTPEHASLVAMVCSFFAAAFAGLVLLAPRTKFTEVDDKIVDAVKNGRKFVEPVAETAWHYIEEADKNGLLPTGVSKAVAFVELVREEYRKKHKTEMPKQVEEFANSIASGMSVADKVVKKAEAIAAAPGKVDPEKAASELLGAAKDAAQNPPSAPASR